MNLVIGSSGLIGRALLEALRRQGLPAIGAARHPSPEDLRLELDHPENFKPPRGPGVAFLCASESRLDVCAAQPQPTHRINVIGTLQLARTLHTAGFRLVFLSSSLVFDGANAFTPNSCAPSPACEYGRQKLLVEQALPPNAAIVRLTKVAESLRPRLEAWRQAMAAGQPITTSAALPIAPIPLSAVVQHLARLAAEFCSGTFQLSSPDELTYAELARDLAASIGASASLVTVEEQRVRRVFTVLPRHATLKPAFPAHTSGPPLPPARIALAPVMVPTDTSPR